MKKLVKDLWKDLNYKAWKKTYKFDGDLDFYNNTLGPRGRFLMDFGVFSGVLIIRYYRRFNRFVKRVVQKIYKSIPKWIIRIFFLSYAMLFYLFWYYVLCSINMPWYMADIDYLYYFEMKTMIIDPPKLFENRWFIWRKEAEMIKNTAYDRTLKVRSRDLNGYFMHKKRAYWSWIYYRLYMRGDFKAVYWRYFTSSSWAGKRYRRFYYIMEWRKDEGLGRVSTFRLFDKKRRYAYMHRYVHPREMRAYNRTFYERLYLKFFYFIRKAFVEKTYEEIGYHGHDFYVHNQYKNEPRIIRVERRRSCYKKCQVCTRIYTKRLETK